MKFSIFFQTFLSMLGSLLLLLLFVVVVTFINDEILFILTDMAWISMVHEERMPLVKRPAR